MYTFRVSPVFSIIICLLLLNSLLIGSSAQASPDRLKENVESAISNYYPFTTFDVSATKEGKIRISGEVNSLYDKLRIFDIISQVQDVREIENALVVNSPDLPDEMVKASIEARIRENAAIIEPANIKINVSNGVVILSGKVTYFREKLMIESICSWQKGVKGIQNNLEVLPEVEAANDENLSNTIKSILKNRFPLQKDVTYTVQNGVVTLNGISITLWAKHQIQREVTRLVGVTKVINNLKVK